MPEARREIPQYSNAEAGRKSSAEKRYGHELTDQLSRFIGAHIAIGGSFHSLLERNDRPKECPREISTLLNWVAYGEIKLLKAGAPECKYSLLAQRYRQALDVQAISGYERIIDIETRLLTQRKWIDNPLYDGALALELLRAGKDYPEPKYLENPYYIEPSVAQVVLGSIKWRLGRLRPDKWGDKVEIFKRVSVEHSFSEDAPDWLAKMIDSSPDRRAGAVDAELAALTAPAEKPLDVVSEPITAVGEKDRNATIITKRK